MRWLLYACAFVFGYGCGDFHGWAGFLMAVPFAVVCGIIVSQMEAR